MSALISLAFESLRMLSFLVLLSLGIVGTATLTGCDKPASDPAPIEPADPDAPADMSPEDEVPPEKADIKIDAPGVDIDIDRTPDAEPDGEVDVDFGREPTGERKIDVNVDPN